MKTVKRKVVRFGQSINLGEFRIEFIKTNHSIQDAAALAIYSPAGIVVHTGDFKVDYTPVYGDAIDLQRFAEIGKKGVLALMCDSTNAERPGFTMSEKTVGATFERIFAEHKEQRLIIATFASNVDRVQQIINTARKYGRKVCLEGRSMVNVIGTAVELGYIDDSGHTLVELDQLSNYPPEKVVLITTGSQGESMAALSRMAANIHKKVKLMPGDVIVFSSHPIPGNEKAISKVINELSMNRSGSDLPGYACIRPCLPGGDQADLLAGEAEIRDPRSRRVASSAGAGRSRNPWVSRRRTSASALGRRAGDWRGSAREDHRKGPDRRDP